ncbi:hypothetical protein L9F63_016509 [Diploptera punctata]|uniref:Malate dehydrogenase n=1 Tax=Diploptera punctata TaxID=6984 RepID=A0AAD8A167_DIPPU|nr:hypothetical protein L9F63_016509 [Diploptera punctata]
MLLRNRQHTLKDIFDLTGDRSDELTSTNQKDQLKKRMEMFLFNPKMIVSTKDAYDSATMFLKYEERRKSNMFLTTESELREFILKTLHVIGVDSEKSNIFATAMIESDKRGYTYEGLSHFKQYILDISGNVCLKNVRPKILSETASAAWVDGARALAPITAKFCIELAISKATKSGIGIVCVKNVTAVGHSAWINSSDKAGLGDNIISYSAPAGFDNFHLQLSSTALSKETLQSHMFNNINFNAEFGHGPNGKLTTKPQEIQAGKRQLPLGLTKTLGAVKGYGLAIVIEVLCGILSGSQFGPFIKESYELENESTNYGECLIVIDPKCFCFGFEIRLAEFLNTIRKLPPVDESKPVLIPGEMETFRLHLAEKQMGILYPSSVVEMTKFIANKLHIPPLKFKTLKA